MTEPIKPGPEIHGPVKERFISRILDAYSCTRQEAELRWEEFVKPFEKKGPDFIERVVMARSPFGRFRMWLYLKTGIFLG